MKDALTTNTLGRKGQGNQGGFRLVDRVCSRREAGEEKRQTDGITRQVGGLSTIFVPAREEINRSFVGKGFAGKQDVLNALFLDFLDDDQVRVKHQKFNFDALFYALGIKSRSWA